jgi:hypothetical protein
VHPSLASHLTEALPVSPAGTGLSTDTVAVVGWWVATGRVGLAHVGGLSDVVGPTQVPSWLTVLTGGVLVGVSFLFNSLLTDHEAIRAVNRWGASLPVGTLRRAGTGLFSLVGLVGLGLVVVSAVVGPSEPTESVAVLVVWVGWWAGFSMSTYLVGNTWPAVNPWRTLGRLLPDGGEDLPERYGAWPAVVGLLVLVWVEVVSPLASEPAALLAVLVAYTVVTLAGAARYGVGTWFDRVDPVARVFATYGRFAPVQRTGDGLRLRLPGAALADGGVDATPGATAFVVALVWVTTFDGLVATPAWNATGGRLLELVVPGGLAGRAVVALVYLAALLAGFALFLGIYRFASAHSRETAESFLAPSSIERWFVPSLIPIAAGYHVAHFLGYFLSLSPALAGALANPVAGVANPQVAVLPAGFGTAQLGFVVLGHLVAVWVAHSLAMELFPGVLRPIRSQYPFVVVMMVYTMTSAWVIGQPTVSPAFL